VTAGEIIRRTDRLRPNTLALEEKLAWLTQLDRRAFEEVILTHEHEDAAFEGHPNSESEMLIPPPWDEVYHFFLCMQMDLAGREMVMYNNDRALFASAWMAWADWVNRKLMPLEAAAIQL